MTAIENSCFWLVNLKKYFALYLFDLLKPTLEEWYMEGPLEMTSFCSDLSNNMSVRDNRSF